MHHIFYIMLLSMFSFVCLFAQEIKLPVTVNPNIITTDKPIEILITADLSGQADVVSTKVKALFNDNSSESWKNRNALTVKKKYQLKKQLQNSYRLFDNGTHGDAVAEDGIYSLAIELEDIQPGHWELRVSLVRKKVGQSYSEPVAFRIYEPFTEASYKKMHMSLKEAANYFKTAVDLVGKKNANTYMAEYIQTLPNVIDAGASEDNISVWCKFSNGVPYVIVHGQNEHFESFYQSALAPELNMLKTVRTTAPRASATKVIKPAVSNSIAAKTATIPINPGNNKAIVISPEWNSTSTFSSEGWITDFLQNLTCWNLESGGLISREDVNLERIKTINDFGIVWIMAHGFNYNTQQGFQLLQELTFTTAAAYANDLVNDRICSIYKTEKCTSCELEMNNNIIVLPGFISTYVDNMPNSLVFMLVCNSYRNNSLSNAFLNDAGAKTYFGWQNQITPGCSRRITEALFLALEEKKTAWEGYTETISDKSCAAGIGLKIGGENGWSFPECNSVGSTFSTENIDQFNALR